MDNDPENSALRALSLTDPSRVLRLKEVCKVTGLGRSFIASWTIRLADSGSCQHRLLVPSLRRVDVRA